MPQATPEQKQIIKTAARQIGVPASWLEALIEFESGFDPQAANPNSSARGLIQFVDASARDLGFQSADDLVQTLPGFREQMFNAVVPYFKQRIKRYGPLRTFQDFTMAVFYPRYIGRPPMTTFPSHVRQVNPGIDTIADYTEFVQRRIDTPVGPSLPPLLFLAAAGAIGWWLWKRGGSIA